MSCGPQMPAMPLSMVKAGETVHVQVNENVGYDIVIRSVEKARFSHPKATSSVVFTAKNCERGS